MSVHKRKGYLTKVVGWVTGDRSVEAQGEAEERLDAPPAPETVDAVEDGVRHRHGETTAEGGGDVGPS